MGWRNVKQKKNKKKKKKKKTKTKKKHLLKEWANSRGCGENTFLPFIHLCLASR